MNTVSKRNRNEESTKELARMLSIAGDATRLSILCFMFEKEEACVSEVADAIDSSVATASYHLNKMADNDFFTRHRDGNAICYRIVESDFIHKLRPLICWNYSET